MAERGALTRSVAAIVRRRLQFAGLEPTAEWRAYVALHFAGAEVPVTDTPASLLRSLFTEDDLQHFGKALGAYTRQSLTRRMLEPLCAGYAVGAALHAYAYRRPGRRLQIERLCGIFNLGIVLFDRVCDVQTDFEALSSFLELPLLTRWLDDPAQCLASAAAGEGVHLPHVVRALLRVIRFFILELARETQVSLRSERWYDLRSLLLDAYRSQVICASATTMPTVSSTALATAVARKSIGPFEIMLAIARACEGELAEVEECEADAACGLVGLAFSLIDDLTDLERDLKSGHPNAILIEAGILPRAQGAALESLADDALLRGGHIARAADRLCATLARLLKLGESTDHLGSGGYDLPMLMLEFAGRIAPPARPRSHRSSDGVRA